MGYRRLRRRRGSSASESKISPPLRLLLLASGGVENRDVAIDRLGLRRHHFLFVLELADHQLDLRLGANLLEDPRPVRTRIAFAPPRDIAQDFRQLFFAFWHSSLLPDDFSEFVFQMLISTISIEGYYHRNTLIANVVKE